MTETVTQSKKAKLSSSIKSADEQIALALDKYLPPMPHLLELPRGTRSILSDRETLEKLPNESRNTLGFNAAEWKNMQYMTFVSVNRRGLTTTRGAWEDDMATWQLPAEKQDPRSRSNSCAPKPNAAKTFKRKFTLAEFKHYQATGERPPSHSASPTPDIQSQSANSQSVNADSLSAELEHVLVTEAASEAKKEVKKPSVVDLKDVKKESAQSSQASASQPSNSNNTSSATITDKSISAINGHTATTSQAKSVDTKSAAVKDSSEKPMTGQNATNGVGKSAASGKTLPNGLNSTSKNGSTTNGDVSSSNSNNPTKAPSSQAPRGQPLPKTNGVSASREPLHSKESNKDVTRPAHSSTVPHTSLPKKPVANAAPPNKAGKDVPKSSLSAVDSSAQSASKKRPASLADPAPAEKRTKIGHSGTPSSSSHHSRTPSNPYNGVRKPDPSGLPPKPKVSAGPTSNPSPRPRALGIGLGLNLSSTSKPGNKDPRKLCGTPRPGSSKAGTPRSDTPRSDMSRDLPPPLSPLHPNFESSPLSEPPTSSALSSFTKNKKQDDQLTAKKTVDKGKGVVKKQNKRSESPVEANGRVSRPLPPLLSPDLPPAVEEALNEVKNQKKTFATVEQRHELARQDGAPGVARIVKSKSSRKTVAAPEPDTQEEPEDSQDNRKLTTLKFKKKSKESLKWINKSRPQPGRGLTNRPLPEAFALRYEETDDEEVVPRAKPTTTRKRRQDDDEEDVPLAKTTAKKKRPADSNTSESAPKRVKAENRDVVRTSATASTARKSTPGLAGRKSTPLPAARISTPLPAAKTSTPLPSSGLASPAPSAPSNKTLLATPKRGDAMRSVAMRKVDSSDGLARTPQPNMTSTPGSVDRTKVNHTSEPQNLPIAEIEKLNSEAASSNRLALKLKRKMDDLLKTKEGPKTQPIDIKDRKQGLATGLESVTAYMNASDRTDRSMVLSGKNPWPESWNRIAGLAGFLENASADVPVLHALACQLGAVCFDRLEQSYLELKEPAKRLEHWDRMEMNNKRKNRFICMAEETKALLKPFGGEQMLGPWSNIKDITIHTITTITAYSRKEQFGWKKDPEFSSLMA